MENIGPMRFIYAFMEVVENHGIFDEFDSQQNRMVTSDPILDLIDMAKEMLPERLSNDEAAEAMRELTQEERDYLIGEDQECVVLDLRDHFSEKMAKNGSARGILKQIGELAKQGHSQEFDELIDMAKEFSERD